MTKIIFDPGRMTVGGLLAIEDAQEGKRPQHAIVEVMAGLMVDEAGEGVPVEEAKATLRALTLNEFARTVEAMNEAISATREKAIPPARAGY